MVAWILVSREMAALGIVAGAFIWLALDSLNLRRLLGWLRQEHADEVQSPPLQELPSLQGVWSDVGSRIRKLLKARNGLLKESQLRLEEFLAAMQASPSGVVLLDAQDRIEWCNQMATEHFGFDAQRDVMQHISNLVRVPAFKAYMATGNFAHDLVIPGSSSTPARPVKLSVHLYVYGNGRQLLLSRDITAVELAENMRRDFVANVSHEIRTPLTVLSGFIETLQTLPLAPAETSRYLTLMGQQSQRMQTLVSDLLTLSRLEGSPFPNAAVWLTTGALFAQCEQEARALSSLLVPNGHSLEFSADGPTEIAGIQAEIYSAISNLVTNAVRYTPDRGHIRVSWNILKDGRGEFKVHDTGPGVAPEHLPRLTERFYRVDPSRSRETGGTGLGLAIVKHVAQRHGAELLIKSELGQGSCFSLIFPPTRVRRVASPAEAVALPSTAAINPL